MTNFSFHTNPIDPVPLLNNTTDGGIAILRFDDFLTSARNSIRFVTAGWKLFETLIVRQEATGTRENLSKDHYYLLIFFKGKKPAYFDKKHILIPTKHPGKVWGSITERQTDGSLRKMGTIKNKTMKCPGTIWQDSDDIIEKLKKCFSSEKPK